MILKKRNGKSVTFNKAILSKADIDFLQLPAPLDAKDSRDGIKETADRETITQTDEFAFLGEAVIRLLKTGNATEMLRNAQPALSGRSW